MYSFLNGILFQEDNQWIDIHALSIIFPNVKHIQVENISLNGSILENILKYLETMYIDSKLKRITLKVKGKSDADN